MRFKILFKTTLCSKTAFENTVPECKAVLRRVRERISSPRDLKVSYLVTIIDIKVTSLRLCKVEVERNFVKATKPILVKLNKMKGANKAAQSKHFKRC